MKQWLILLSLGLLVVLSGCRSQHEAKIFNALNEAQNVFYREITPSTPVARLDELVTAINLAIDEANAISLLHQEALVTFNTSYTNYYETYIK